MDNGHYYGPHLVNPRSKIRGDYIGPLWRGGVQSNKTSTQGTPGSQIYHSNQNKTSIQWNPGSQIYRSNKKKIFGQK